MRGGMGAFVLSGALGLAACAPSESAVTPIPFSSVETNSAVATFSATCLQTLPDFSDFEQVARSQGLTKTEQSEPEELVYIATKDQFMTSILGREAGQQACGIAFLGSDDFRAVGTTFLTRAQQETGGAVRERFPTEGLAFVYQLRNGSLITYDVRPSPRQTRHLILVTAPLSADEVAVFLGE